MKAPPLQPDQDAQHRTSRVIVAGALLLAWAVVAVQSQLEAIDRLAQANVPAATEYLVWLVRIVAFALSLGILAMGGWTWWLGHRVVRSGHFPPPETKIVRPTRVYTGPKARTLGWLAQSAGVLVLLLGTLTAWLFVRCAEFLLRR